MMGDYLSFIRDEYTGNVLKSWFEGLSRGEKATLRQCRTVEEVALTAPFHSLKARLSHQVDPERLALVAGISSHVKKDFSSQRIAIQMAVDRSGKGKEPVSDLRFRKLLAIDDRSELYRTMIRIIRILGGEVNLLSLADAVYWWNISMKKQFASDYYDYLESHKRSEKNE